MYRTSTHTPIYKKHNGSTKLSVSKREVQSKNG